MKHLFRIGAVALLHWLLLPRTVQAQAQPSILFTSHPTQEGNFGRSVAIDNGIVAIASEEITDLGGGWVDEGAVTVFERSPTGDWLQTQRLHRSSAFPQFPFGGTFGEQVVMSGDSLIVKNVGGQPFGFEYRRVGGQWIPQEAIFAPTPQMMPNLGLPHRIAYDGTTLVVSHSAASNGGSSAPGRFLIYRWNGSWQLETSFSAVQLGIQQAVQSSVSGYNCQVDGDLILIDAKRANVAGVAGVGSVFVLRRTNWTWGLVQRIDHPLPVRDDLWFGTTMTYAAGRLFVMGLVEAWDTALLVTPRLVPQVFEYELNASGQFELRSTLRPTIGPGLSGFGAGWGNSLVYRPPTLYVGAELWMIPGQGPGSPTGGAGSVLAYERCGDVWNQRVALTAPHDLGGALIGRTIAYDGQTLVSGGLNYTGYPIPGPPGYTSHAGIAMVVDDAAPTGTGCIEFGRPICAPASNETRDCPCGGEVPGRGCPNGHGPGARLYLHGGFNQLEVRRAIVDGLPPGATTILAWGRPSSFAPFGQLLGDGVLCVPGPVHWTVGAADPSGMTVFDDVPMPDGALLGNFSFHELPVQALYHTATPGPCGGYWNTSNAVSLRLDRY